MPNNIKEVYEIFENIRTRLDDSYIISEIFNYFDVDQLSCFCESMIDSYDLDPVEMGVINYIPEEDQNNEDDLNTAYEDVRNCVNETVESWHTDLENTYEDMQKIYQKLATSSDYFANEFDKFNDMFN